MNERRAKSHFDRLGDLLAGIELTDGMRYPLPLDEGIDAVIHRISEPGADSRTVMLVGNGGSASIADHIQLDLSTRCRIRAKVFTEPAVLTALSNDHGYDSAFERMVATWAREGDCLIAISSSGRSENVHRAVHAARKSGCGVITMSGFEPDNALRSLGDFNFYIASTSYGEVEVVHHALGHYLTDRVSALFSAPQLS